MGVDTKGYLDKDITASDVFNVICYKFDPQANFNVRNESGYDIGTIDFMYNDEQRNLFYCVTSDRLENTPWDREKHVSLILRKWGSSVQIMTEIVSVFGGYVDEDDCDDMEAVFISKNENFAYMEFIQEKNSILDILDENLSSSLKQELVAQILKHSEQLKNVL